jgi:hypothetical protein
MKALIFTSIFFIGLTVFSYGKPINDIYSIKEPILAEESNVNDIPFDTHEIACRYLLGKMLETSGEINIDDIPFDTERIYCEHLAALLITQYKNEQNTSDLPETPDFFPEKMELLRSDVKNVGLKQQVLVFPGFSL